MYSVKNVKSFRGEDGMGFSGTLYKGKKRIAYVVDYACGGEYRYDFFDANEEKEFDRYCKSLPIIKNEYGEFPRSWDSVVAEIVNKYEEDKYYRAKCKNHWVVKFEGDKPEEYHKWKKEMYRRSVIEKHFGDKIVEFINDRYEK